MHNFKKVSRIGMAKTYGGRSYSVFVEIEYKDHELTIHGVEGPTREGNCLGGCGQINMSLKSEELRPVNGWDRPMLAKFFDIWDRWHLNNMRSGCEHQRAEWDTKKKVTLYKFTLTVGAIMAQSKLQRSMTARLQAGETVQPLPEESRLLSLAHSVTLPTADLPGPEYTATGQEVKSVGWLRPEEHPEGLLCKPCLVCGYEYGTARLMEEVPEEVLQWLYSLPNTDRQPAWV